MGDDVPGLTRKFPSLNIAHYIPFLSQFVFVYLCLSHKVYEQSRKTTKSKLCFCVVDKCNRILAYVEYHECFVHIQMSFLHSYMSKFGGRLILMCIANSVICSNLGWEYLTRRWDYTRVSNSLTL